MPNVLVAIGCDDYTHLQPLRAACSDARRIFERLVESSQPYDSAASVLLCSPDTTEVNKTLRRISQSVGIDVLTFFFAGHGTARNSSYFLCLRDTDPNSLAMTALPLQTLLLVTRQIEVRHLNVVLDACQAGNAMFELNSLIRSAEMTDQQAGGVSFLASARSSENANEGPQGGLATNLILSAIDGSTRIQESRPSLSLIEVGGHVSRELVSSVSSQTPISWGISLYGDEPFCKNFNYRGAAEPPSLLGTSGMPADVKEAIGRTRKSLWDIYASYQEEGSPLRLLSKLLPLAELSSAESHRAIVSLCRSFAERALVSKDLLATPTTLAAGCALGLASIEFPESLIASDQLLDEFVCASNRSATALLEAFSIDADLLVSNGHGVADLVYLPIRVVELLGWIGTVAIAEARIPCPELRSALRDLAQVVVSQHGAQLRAVSDGQGAHAHLFLLGSRHLGIESLTRIVFGSLFADFVENQGRVLPPLPDGKTAFLYALARGTGRFEDPRLLARPSLLLSSLLLSAKELGFGDAWDHDLARLDHQPICYYVPRRYADFWNPTMREGSNLTVGIGSGVWTCDDVQGFVAEKVKTAARTAAEGLPRRIDPLLAAASLLLPNRLPLSLSLEE